MSLETSHATDAILDRAAVHQAEEICRAKLLEALTAIQALKFTNASLRDAVVDEASKYFHPDNQSDAFSDAFHPVKLMADRMVEEAQDELSLSQRRVGYQVAAE